MMVVPSRKCVSKYSDFLLTNPGSVLYETNSNTDRPKSNGLAVCQTKDTEYTPKFVTSCLTHPRAVEFRYVTTTVMSDENNTVKKNIVTLLVVSKKVGLKANAEEATHGSVSSELNVVQNVSIKTGNKYEVLPKNSGNLTIKKFLL